MIETVPLAPKAFGAAEAYGRMMRNEARFRIVLVTHREVVDNPIRGAVPCGQHGSVDGLMPRRPQQRAQARRQMRVHQELHASTRCWLLSLSDWAAKSRQARRSSRSKSGNSSRRSSKESPAARYSSMDST